MEIPTDQGFVAVVENQLYKKVLQEGQGEQPKKGQEVYALYKGTLTNGDLFDSNESREDPFKFVIGQGQVIKGWDEGFASMKKGEKAVLQIGPEYGYGKSGSGKIPANATLIFEVELLDCKDKQKEKWELSDEEKLSDAKGLKEKATQAFKNGDYAAAVTLYDQAVGLTEELESEEAEAFNVTIWSNLALANNKLKKYSTAITNANKVIAKDAKNVKALYRRGVSHLGLENFESAQTDFNQILSLDPNNNEAKNELAKVKQAVQKSQKRAKDVYSKIFASNYYEDKKIEAPKPTEPEADSSEDEVPEKPMQEEKEPAPKPAEESSPTPDTPSVVQ